MRTISSGDAKARFGHLIDMTQKEPVAIEKHGRPVSVMMAFEDFERYQMLEDKFWALEAKAAEKEGYLSSSESDEFLKSL